MKSRMDKYYKDEDMMQRTSKNDSLYEELYKQKQVPRSNITVIDNVNEIDVTKIKSMVDSREKYKRVRDYEKIVSGIDNYKTSEIKYDFDEIDNSNYDINEILKNKRSSKVYDENKVRRLNNIDYDIMDRPRREEEYEDDLLGLGKTMSRTAVREQTDLFSNLKEDTIKLEKTEVKEDKVTEEEFYTNTTKFDSDDFMDDLKENTNNNKIFIIVGGVAILIAIGVIIYLKFF